ALELAETIRSQRYQLSKQAPYRRPIGKHWLDRFRTRYPEIQGVWTRQIESARYTALNTATVQGWFDAVTALYIQHQYLPERIYNMDESGFAIGASQSSRVLRSSWKVIKGRQEWITAVECVSAAKYAISPLLIFKAEYTNTSWIPVGAPLDWRFSTSNSGWTSNSHAFEWIRTVFEPCTRPATPEKQAGLEAAQKKPKKKVKEGAKATIIDNNKEEDIEIVFSDSDSDCIVVAATRSS
ncbi:hypothetical protein M433DRAFT_73513, partial [Acidomyces richmondensis BFW]